MQLFMEVLAMFVGATLGTLFGHWLGSIIVQARRNREIKIKINKTLLKNEHNERENTLL